MFLFRAELIVLSVEQLLILFKGSRAQIQRFLAQLSHFLPGKGFVFQWNVVQLVSGKKVLLRWKIDGWVTLCNPLLLSHMDTFLFGFDQKWSIFVIPDNKPQERKGSKKGPVCEISPHNSRECIMRGFYQILLEFLKWVIFVDLDVNGTEFLIHLTEVSKARSGVHHAISRNSMMLVDDFTFLDRLTWYQHNSSFIMFLISRHLKSLDVGGPFRPIIKWCELQ